MVRSRRNIDGDCACQWVIHHNILLLFRGNLPQLQFHAAGLGCCDILASVTQPALYDAEFGAVGDVGDILGGTLLGQINGILGQCRIQPLG